MPPARLATIALDLTDPARIERFSSEVTSRTDRLDIVLNSAGMVNLETLPRTPPGHEMHMETSHYGHFVLTGHLFATRVATPGARVVTVTSGAYRSDSIDFHELDWRNGTYSRVQAHGDGNLVNLLFMHAFQTRFDTEMASVLSLAAHPGLTGTERQQSIGIGGMFARLAASPIDRGVRSQLRAATDAAGEKRDVHAPWFGLRGPPSVARLRQLRGERRRPAKRLWTVTEEITVSDIRQGPSRDFQDNELCPGGIVMPDGPRAPKGVLHKPVARCLLMNRWMELRNRSAA